MTPVTDPALLAQLNADDTGADTGGTKVTDPALLAQLNAGVAPAAVGPEPTDGPEPTIGADGVPEVVVTAKPLTWLDVPATAFENLGGSAVDFAKNIVQPILHPIQTAKNFRDVGAGVMQHFRDVSPKEFQGTAPRMDTKAADAVGRFLIKRYGSLDALKNTMARDPVGFFADASAILSAGGSLAATAPGVVGKLGEAAAIAGRAVDPLNAAVQAVKGTGKLGGELAAQGLGFSTGAGGAAIKEAARTGAVGGDISEVFRGNLRGTIPVDEVVTVAKQALSRLHATKTAEYKAGMGVVSRDPTVLNFTDINNAVDNVRKIGMYKGIVKNPKAAEAWADIDKTVSEWAALDPAEYHTPEGLDALKQKLSDIEQNLPYGTPSWRAANQVRRAVKDVIVKQAPTYSKVMAGYENASNHLDDLERSLSLGNKGNIDTAVRKLQSVMRNNVTSAFGRRAELARELEAQGADTLFPALAGQALSSPLPRGLTGIGSALTSGAGVLANPVLGGLGLAASSPRVVGEAAHLVGIASRYPSKALNVAGEAYAANRGVPLALAEAGRLGLSPDELQALTDKYSKGKPPTVLPTETQGLHPELQQMLDAADAADAETSSTEMPEVSDLTARQIQAESGGDPNAVSPKGAEGLMQVMPATQASPGYGVAPPRDSSPQENVRTGEDYRNAMVKKYGGDLRLALAAYNWGPGNVDRWLAEGGDPAKLPQETRDYVNRIIGGGVSAARDGR